MTSFLILIGIAIIIILLAVLLMRKPADMSQNLMALRRDLREDNTMLREKLAANLGERLGALAATSVDLKNIGADIASFKNVLMGNKQARGRFGELQLEDLVRNIMPPDSYEFQRGENGVRPDCTIKLPYPPGDIIIDSKFPLEGYDKMVAAKNPDEKEFARKQFDLAVRTHVDAIATKYIIPGKTAESALMFVAAESIFETLHTEFANVIDYAARKKVFIVSPATLWATLNTIRAVLSDIKIKKVAGQIKKELDLLLTDLSRLSDRANKVENHFKMTENDLEDLQISIRKIAPRAEKIRDLEFGD